MPNRVAIEALVHPCEHLVMQFAAQHLADQLRAAGQEWRVRVRFVTESAPISPGAIVFTSVLPDVIERRLPMAQVAHAWYGRLPRMTAAGNAVFLCTAFRGAAAGPAQAAIVERTRRMNRLAVDLSCATGAYIVDIDRVFGLVGGYTLKTDHCYSSAAAVRLAGQVIVRCLLAAGLDDVVAADVLTRAQAAGADE